jgi:hypothetical protein
MVARDGGIFSFGDARFFGSTGGIRLNYEIVGMAATLSGHGYWMVARDGGIFSFGDAHFYGSPAGGSRWAPVMGMTLTPSGRGYWMIGRDNTIWRYGDAGSGTTRGLRPVGGWYTASPYIAIVAA